MTLVMWPQAAVATELRRELARLLEVFPSIEGVEEVWLFGSALTGPVHTGSDLDLLVIRETTEPVASRAVTLAQQLQPRVPVDFFIYTPIEAARGGRFLNHVLVHGRRLL